MLGAEVPAVVRDVGDLRAVVEHRLDERARRDQLLDLRRCDRPAADDVAHLARVHVAAARGLGGLHDHHVRVDRPPTPTRTSSSVAVSRSSAPIGLVHRRRRRVRRRRRGRQNASAARASRGSSRPSRCAARQRRSVSRSRRLTKRVPATGSSRKVPATMPSSSVQWRTERAACCFARSSSRSIASRRRVRACSRTAPRLWRLRHIQQLVLGRRALPARRGRSPRLAPWTPARRPARRASRGTPPRRATVRSASRAAADVVPDIAATQS